MVGSKEGEKEVAADRSSRKHSSFFCMFGKVRSAEETEGSTPVYLNVYDLTSMNALMYWTGLGVFHSGIEVHGLEYAFGAHDSETSGIFTVKPRKCPQFKFRKSIFVGTTSLDPTEVKKLMEQHSEDYSGDSYHLIDKNCNHFCRDMCQKLTGNSIPSWVNRLANIGSKCRRVLPKSLQVSDVDEKSDDEDKVGETKRLRCAFSSLYSPSLCQKQIAT